MKYNYLLFLLFVLTTSSSLRAQEKESGKAIIQTTIHCNHCKACETCGLNFKDNMLKIKGVKMYVLDEEKMTFTVYYNPKKTNLNTIRTAISKLGYDADQVKAEPTAYNKLDNCCKPV